MSQLENYLQHLATLLSKKNDGYIAEVEACLADIVTLNTPKDIDGLLTVFDESAPDEVMFSIIHTIERWNDQTFSEALIASVEKVWKSAPRWAKVLHIRIMNSQNTSDVYFDLVKHADAETQSVVRDIYAAIGKGWPKLGDKVKAALDRLS